MKLSYISKTITVQVPIWLPRKRNVFIKQLWDRSYAKGYVDQIVRLIKMAKFIKRS